ncbi:translation initiation factor eIF-2B [Marinobacter sp.]|uniref:translation initiation factor eIF-2B n=1 Tax=Marinobacter sp. TaxID=50741 RepID=UPI003566C828
MDLSDLDSEARKIVETVRADTVSGAAQLAVAALQQVRQWLSTGPVTANALDRLLTVLAKTRPSMVPLANAIERCRQDFGRWQANPSISHEALPILDAVLDQLVSANQRVAAASAALIPANATLFTHSRSSQVLALFRLLVQQHHQFSVICTQSSPGNEGYTLARELDELGVPVTVITDAQMGLFLQKADLILCGCDTWLGDGYFLNKSGSYPLALLAKERGKPFWVLADSFKDSTVGHNEVSLEEMAGEELRAPTGPHITVRNIYFEPVPVHLVSGRVSELGVFSFPAEPGR